MPMRLYSFVSYVFLLPLLISCKQEPQEAAPNLATCRIVKTTYKTSTIGRKPANIVDPEMLTLEDGSKMEVSWVTTTTYSYDAQERIVETKDQKLNNNYGIDRYSYTPNYLIKYTEYSVDGIKKPSIGLDTVQLNERGLIARWYGEGLGQPYIVYNQADQLINNIQGLPIERFKYIDGNLTHQIDNASWVQRNGQWVPTDYLRKRYQYDLNRPNLPLIYQFEGKASRNLPTQETWETPDRLVYRKVFTYTFDKWDRVIRRVSHGKALTRDWLIEDDTYGLGVTDYEYECP